MEQIGELRIERAHVAGAHTFAVTPAAADCPRLGWRNFDREQTSSVEHRHRLALAGSGQRSLTALAVVRQGVRPLHDHFTDGVRGDHELVDARSAAEAALVTGPATGAFPEPLARLHREVRGPFVMLGRVLDLALLADGPH